MYELKGNEIILDASECADDIEYVNFNLKNKYLSENPALKINFTNNLAYNIACIKKLIYFEKKNIEFNTTMDNLKVKYIISNYDKDTLCALKAIFIKDKKAQYTYIYENIFETLDKIWEKNNPCKFCNNICVASRNNMTAHKEDGCCYSFTYSKKPFELENVHHCQYLGNDKKCTTQNLSCKFFVCKYLKKENLFNINMKDFLLVQAFFSKKQQLILKNNFFKSKDEIINKLLEKNSFPLWVYYLSNKYMIS